MPEDSNRSPATMTTYRSAARKLKVARIAGEGLRRLDTGNTESSVQVVSLPDFAVKALSRPRGRSFLGERPMIFPSTACAVLCPHQGSNLGPAD